jgi:hypothetical protein
MAKMSRAKKQTMVTFVMDGSDDRRAFTISFIPWFREIILSGRKALRALKAFSDYRLAAT